jgi:predicted dinucleotide-binding enzyme
MTIAIVGSGNVGGALAQTFIKAGHSVFIGARLPLSEKSIKLASIIGEDRFIPVKQAAKQADVIIITTPPDAILSLIPQLGAVQHKIIVDATNSVRTRPEGFATAFHAIKEKTGSEQVVKCFNTTGYENMLNPVYQGAGIDLFCAGNHKESKQTIIQLTKEIGFGNCYDFGGDDKVQLLEQFALSWINLAIMQGLGRTIAFKIIHR